MGRRLCREFFRNTLTLLSLGKNLAVIFYLRANGEASAAINWFDYQAIGHSVFAVGRLLSAIGGLFIKPRRVLMFLYIGVIVTSVLAMNVSGYSGVAMIILVLFFEVTFHWAFHYEDGS